MAYFQLLSGWVPACRWPPVVPSPVISVACCSTQCAEPPALGDWVPSSSLSESLTSMIAWASRITSVQLLRWFSASTALAWSGPGLGHLCCIGPVLPAFAGCLSCSLRRWLFHLAEHCSSICCSHLWSYLLLPIWVLGEEAADASQASLSWPACSHCALTDARCSCSSSS